MAMAMNSSHSKESINMMSVNQEQEGRSKFWTKDLEVSLAEKIRMFPELYVSEHPNFRNHSHRHDIWKRIANELKTTVEECKRKYKLFRNKLVKDHKYGKRSDWPAAEAMDFVLPIAIRRRTKRERNRCDQLLMEKTGVDDSSKNFVGVESGSYNYCKEDATVRHPSSSRNELPTVVVDARSISKSDHEVNSNKRKFADVDNSSGNYYNKDKDGNVGRLSPVLKSVLDRNRMLNNTISLQNNSNPKQQQYKNENSSGTATQNSNRNKNQHSTASSNSNQGSNYHFGQYVSSALDAIPEVAANETREKVQELLFKAQLKQTYKSFMDGQSQNGVSPPFVVLFDRTTGRQQMFKVEKDTV